MENWDGNASSANQAEYALEVGIRVTHSNPKGGVQKNQSLLVPELQG